MASQATYPPGPAPTRKRGQTAGAQTAGAGNSQAQLVRQSNIWRENYNPLRGLILKRVVSMLEAYERGDYAEVQWLYRFVEKRFPVLRSLVIRRRSALTKLDWEVKMVELPPIDEGTKGTVDQGLTAKQAERDRLIDLAKAQRDYLRARYNLIVNLKDSIKQLALAEFRGYTLLNKHRYQDGPNDGAVQELHWLPQWNFVRDGMFGDWYWNPKAMAGATARTLGEANRLDPADFIIREVEMPINEIGIIAFVRSNLSQKDWDAFIEIFGIPGCVVVMPGNIPVGKEDEYRSTARSVAEGASGAIPNGADVKFPGAAARQNTPFKEHLEYQEKDVVLAGTGGKLTMLTGPVGLGGKQAEVHEDVFDEIATAEAGEISEIFQCQFDKPELELAFPGQPVLAYFQLQPVDKSAAEKTTFKRDVFKAFMADGTVADVLANQTDLKQLTVDCNLPVNEQYTDPYLPVKDNSGQLVSGEVVTDAEGDVIGAKPQAGTGEPPPRPTPPGQPGALRNRRVRNAARPGPSAKLEQNGLAEYARAVQADLAPVMERLQRIMAIDDPAVLESRLRDFVADMDGLKADLSADPAASKAIERMMNAGFFSGIKEPQKLLNGDVPGHEFHGNQWTEEQGRLRGEADAAHVAAHNAEYGKGSNASDEELAALHKTASEKYKAARDHAAQAGARGTVRVLGQKARVHKEWAGFYAERAKGKKQ